MSEGLSMRDASAMKLLAGPRAPDELPMSNPMKLRDVLDVRFFRPRAGRLSTVGVYYLPDHPQVDVVEKFLDENEGWAESLGGPRAHRTMVSHLSRSWAPYSREALARRGMGVSRPGGDQSGSPDGGDCPLCGEEYDRYLADHLPDCTGGQG